MLQVLAFMLPIKTNKSPEILSFDQQIAHKYVTQFSKSNLQNKLDKLIIQHVVQIFEVLSHETSSLSKIEKNIFSQSVLRLSR